MGPTLRILWALLFCCLLSAGCNDEDSAGDQDTDQNDKSSSDGGDDYGDDDEDEYGDDDDDVYGDDDDDDEYGDDDDDDQTAVCETVNAGLASLPTRVMLLEDRSTSMKQDNKWKLAKQAIEMMVGDFDKNIDFGLDLFSVTQRFGFGLDMCAVSNSAVLDVESENGDAINDILDGDSPNGATPLLLAIRNYTKDGFAPKFMDKRVDSYLVIISDGMDTCGSEGNFNPDRGASAAELAEETKKIRETMGINIFVIGFGEGADPEQLDAIAAAGGTEFTTHFDAADGDQLSTALTTIAKSVAVSCKFEVGDIDRSNLNMDLVNISVSGKNVESEAIPRDDDCAKKTGWTWTDDGKTTIKFCEDACKRLESGDIEQVSMEFACSSRDVNVV